MGKPLRTHGGAIGGVLHSRSKEPPRRAQRLFLRRLQAIHGAGSFGGQSGSIGREPLGPASRAEGERQEGHSRVREPWRAPGLVDLSSFIYKSWERIQRRPGRRVSRYPSPVHEALCPCMALCVFSQSVCVPTWCADGREPLPLEAYGWLHGTDCHCLPQREGGSAARGRVLETLRSTHRRLSHCPLLPPLVALASNFLEEPECFCLLDEVLSRPSWICQDQRENLASISTLVAMTRGKCVSGC